MFTYYYECKKCGEVIEHEWAGKLVPPTHCDGEEMQWLGGKAPATFKASYRSGYKRPGFAEGKEAARLTQEAIKTQSGSETRREVAKEIKKMGIKPGKDLV